jgi:U1 small nuclear ribonucleoprotein
MPNPPLEPIPSISYRRRNQWTGVAQYMIHLEKTSPPERILLPTPKSIREQRKRLKMEQHQRSLLPLIQQFRNEQKECGGEYKNMNCYNTLFIGRLSYEVTERKLLREMEAFGPIKDIHIIKRKVDTNKNNNNDDDDGGGGGGGGDTDMSMKSCGYAFVEYEHEEDMKRAYRAMDGVRMEGRDIVVDVERGHTVPDFLPRRLGGGLGGTRMGSKEMNVTRPGRYDPTREHLPPSSSSAGSMPPYPPSGGMGRGMGVPVPNSSYGGLQPPPPPVVASYGSDRYGTPGPPPSREWNDDRNYRRGGDGYNMDRSKRRRSHSPPDQRYGGGSSSSSRRPRY